ncbi:MAG: DNA-binding protein WhiA [Lachnospiraceae bacterium]|nr:DNA-binding protein WhiA [Lachnospiraceae bacterium]
MSFSQEVKEELLSVTGSARHCLLAELAAIFCFCGFVENAENNRPTIGIFTENKTISIKCFTLLKKTFNIYSSVSVRKSSQRSAGSVYTVKVENSRQAEEVLLALKLLPLPKGMGAVKKTTDLVLLKNACCKRAYIRGAYLVSGSMSNPEKGYHLEFVCGAEEQAEMLIHILKELSIEAKEVLRKKYFVVYIKDGEAIVELLGLMGAHRALMELESTRVVKEVRNSINRRVNCEAANITKTVNAAAKQVEDIMYLKEKVGFSGMPESLRQMAKLRLDHPDATLKELSELSDPPVGKSGVNHRLRKLSELAERLRLN